MTLLLLACTGSDPKPDTALHSLDDTGGTDTETHDTAPPEDLGDPYLAMVAATPPDYLLSTCRMRVDVYIDGKAVDGAEILAGGGEWVGLELSGDSQYTASATYEECTKLNPTGTVESGAFSGVAGYLFLFWYSGANQGYDTLVQTVDYSGGMAEITLEDGADTAGIDTIAASLGVTLTLREGTTYDATFPTEIPVGRVLSEFAKDEAFAEGSPAWIDAPSWW